MKKSNPSKAELRRLAEEKLGKQKQASRPPVEADTRRLVHELEVHQIELEMQNEQLLQAQAELEGSLRQYSDLYNLAPVGYFTLATDGSILRVNLEGAKLLGAEAERAKLVKRRLGIFVSSGSRPAFNAFLKKVFTSQKNETCDVSFEKDGQGLLWAHLEAISEDGQECKLVVMDVTKRKQAEEALFTSQDRLAHLLQTVPSGITMVDRSGGITFANRAAEKILGLSRSDISGRLYNDPTWKIVAVDGGEFPDEQLPFVRVMQTGQPVQDIQHAIQHPDGRRVMLSINADPLHDAQGAITGMVAAITDITTQYHSDQALRESEQIWHSLVSASPDFIALHDSEGRFLFLNHYAEGYSEKDVIGTSVYDYQSPESVDQFRRHFLEALHTGVVQNFEHIAMGGKGVSKIYDEYLVPIRTKTDEINVMAIARDITERKQAEQQNKQMALMLDTAPSSITVHDFHGRFLFANQKTFEMHSYNSEEFMALNLHQLDVPDSENLIAPRMQELSEKGEASFEVFHQRKDGSSFPLEVHARMVTWGDEKVILSIATDITERKQAEKLLHDNEQRFSTIFHSNPAAIAITRMLDGKLVDVNQSWLTLTGFRLEEVIGHTPLELNLWVDPAQRKHLVQSTQEQGKRDDVVQVRRKSGEVRDLLMEAEILELSDEKYLLSMAQDITERIRNEEALVESHNTLRSWLNAIQESAFLIDRQGIILACNETAARRLNHSMVEMVGACIYDVIPAKVAQSRREQLTRAIESGEPMRFEDQRLGRTIDNLIYPVLDSAGQVKNLAILGADITERKQLEQTLREDEQRLASIYTTVGDIIFYLAVEPNGQYRFNSVNPAFLKVTGLSSDQIIGHLVSEVIPEPSLSLVLEKYRQAIDEQGIVRWEETSDYPSGRLVGEVSVAPVFDPSGTASHLVGSVHDITGRKQAEQEIRVTSERLTHMIATSPTVIYALKAEGDAPVPFWISENIRLILGFNPEDPLQPGWWLKHVHVQDRPQAQESLEHLFDDEFHQEYRFLHKEGRVIWLYDVHRLLRDADNKPWEIIGAWTDITLIKQAEEALKEYNQRLEAEVSSRTRELRETQEKLVRQEKLAVLGQLAGGVGHELRNPLSVINTSIYYLRLVQPEASEKVKQHHAMIEQEVHTADKIISDLLDFGRVTTADRESFSVPELVQRVLKRYPVPPSVKLTLELPASLPQAYADPHQVEQVLGNLTVNACQAMPGGGKLSVSCEQLSVNSEQWVRIAVKDTGTGITPENMAKLFEPLFTTKLKGIGLGLAVSKKLAEANGGRIEVTSEPGKGSTFTLWLPVKKE